MQVHELWSVYTGQRFIAVMDEEGILRDPQGANMGQYSDPESGHTDDGNYRCIVRDVTDKEKRQFGQSQTSKDDVMIRTNRISSGGKPTRRQPQRRPQTQRVTPQFARR